MDQLLNYKGLELNFGSQKPDLPLYLGNNILFPLKSGSPFNRSIKIEQTQAKVNL